MLPFPESLAPTREIVMPRRNSWRRLPGALIGLLLLTAGASAGDLVGFNFIVWDGAGAQGGPSVAADSVNGRYLVAWRELDAVAGRLYDLNGDSIGPRFVINGSSGEVAVTWNSVDEVYLAVFVRGCNTVTGQRISPDGGLLGDPFDIFSEAQCQAGLDVAHDSGFNRYLVAWGRTGGLLRGRLIQPNGAAVGAAFTIDDTAGAGNPSVAAIPSDASFVVAWDALSATVADVYARRVAVADGALGALRTVSDAVNLQAFPAVAVDPATDTAVVVWQDQRDGTIELYGQAIAGNGSLSGPNRLVSDTPGGDYTPSIAWSAAEDAYLLIWTATHVGGSDLVSRLVPADVVIDGLALGVSVAGGAGAGTAVAIDPASGRALAVWPDGRFDANGDIFAQVMLGACIDRTFDPPVPGTGAKYGEVLANAGDVNGDGHDDVIIGAPYDDTVGNDAGRIWVIDPLTGHTLLAAVGQAAGDRFGYAVGTAGDFDGDGYADVMIGAPRADAGFVNAGVAYILSGRTAQTLFLASGAAKFDEFGSSVAGGGNLDGDGYPDFMIGAPLNDDGGAKAGRVYIYQGIDGTLIKSIRGVNKGERLGQSLAWIGRADGDNKDDFILGAPGWGPSNSKKGRVYVYSGADQSLLYRINGKKAGDEFGFAVAGVGRANGDNKDDFAVGAPFHDPNGMNKAGRVDVYSGKTGQRLWFALGDVGAGRMGWSLAGGIDLDDNGRDEVLVGAPRHNGGGAKAGRVEIRRGENGTVMQTIDGNAGDYLGSAVAAVEEFGEPSGIATGSPRADEGASNSGLAELWCTASFPEAPLAPIDPPAGDVDGDGRADVDDLLELVAQLGRCPDEEPCDADLDGDGRVDERDLVLLLESIVAERN